MCLKRNQHIKISLQILPKFIKIRLQMCILLLRHCKKWRLYEREEHYTRTSALNAAQILADMVWQTYWMVWIWFCSGNGSFIPNHQHWCWELLLSQKSSWEMNPKWPSPTIQTEGRMCLQWTIPPVWHFCILEGTLEMKFKDAAANFILI